MVVVVTGVNKCRIKFVPMLSMRADGQWRYSSTHLFTAMEGGGYLASYPDTFAARERCLCTQ